MLKNLEKPFHVSFEITSKCDFDCSFCYARLNTTKKPDLSTNGVKKIIKKLADEEIYSLFISGGEPLIRLDFEKIVKYALDLHMNTSISTNGANITKERAKKLIETGIDMKHVQVSIHAPDHTHDYLVRTPGAIESSMAGLKNLIDAGGKPVVAAIVTKQNCNKLPELAKKVTSMGVDHFRILRLMIHSKDMLKQIPSFEMLKKTVEELEKIEKETGAEIAVHAPPGFVEKTDGRKQYKIVHPLCHTCSAGKIAMGIFSDGTVTPCLELRDKKFECGNLLKDSVDDVWHSDVMEYHRKITPGHYNGQCGVCESKWSCYSARCSAYSIYDDFLADDASCYILNNKK